MVELALVLPVLLLVLIGVVQLALIRHAQNVATTAAQEGARLAAEEGGQLLDGEMRAREVLRSGLGETAEAFEVTAADAGETVSLQARGSSPLILPWFGGVSIEIEASTEMIKEGFRSGP